MVELQVITNCILKDLPAFFYWGLISFFVLGIILLLWQKGLKDGLRHGAILLLAEWIIFVLGIAVIFRGNSAERSINLIPLSSYYDYGEHSYLMEKVALNILNVVLFLPVGLLLGCGFREMTWKKAFVFGLVLSASIELFQLIFCKGLCEVDDVIHNVLGCMIGFGIIKICQMRAKTLYKLTFIAMLIALTYQTSVHLWDYLHGVYGYEYGCLNEMLVNYEGGFIRRGLFGELLFVARGLFDFSVADAIVFLYYLGVSLLTILLIWMFRKNGWSLFILPFPICLYVFYCDPYFMIGRRDCWLLLLAFLCYYFYFMYVRRGKRLSLVVCFATQLFALLLHEASLFFIFPIIAIHDFNQQYVTTNNLMKASMLTISHWWAVPLLTLMIVLNHGDETIIHSFWQSWSPYIDVTENLISDSYISRTLDYPFWYHMTEVLWPTTWLSCLVWRIPVWPFNIYLFICTYYLVTRYNTIHIGIFMQKGIDKIQLSNILLVLFCSMFVFMSVCSCDWGRDFPYWVISSFMFFHFFRSIDDSPLWLTRLSQRLQNKIDQSPFLCSQWGYYLLLITLPLGFMGASLSSMFPFFPLTLKHLLLGQPMVIG